MMSENQSRRVLGEHKVVESIQSIADWVTKAKKVMSDIKSNKVDYNFYEITSDLEEDIARTDSDMEKEVLTGLLHSLNNAYSKIADKDDKEDIREDKELLVEDDLNGLKRYADELKTYIGMDKNRPEMQSRQKELDSIIEKLWVALEDVPFIEGKNRELILDGEYLDFPKGTTRDKIWHWFDDMYSKGVAYLINDFDITAHRATESKKITEDNEEDLDEAFYEKICRAYIDTVNLEWVTTNPENNDSVVHGYFADDSEAEKWGYGEGVSSDNFKEVAYDGYSDEEIENGNVEWYEYETWEDFYNDYVKENIEYDINDIGVYDFNDNWDFYISEEDLTKLGLWNEDIKSEFLDESKKVTENISFDNIMDYRELIDGDNGDLVDTFFFDHKLTEEEDIAIIEAINKAKSDVEDYDNYTVMEYINKVVPIKQSLSAIYADLGPSSKKQIKY